MDYFCLIVFGDNFAIILWGNVRRLTLSQVISSCIMAVTLVKKQQSPITAEIWERIRQLFLGKDYNC